MTSDDDPRRLAREIGETEIQLAALHGVSRFQDRLAAEVVEAMNRAAAAVMFDKPGGTVSADDARRAGEADFIVAHDRPKSDKARRAALSAALAVLAFRGAFPQRMADYTADVFAHLDRGGVEGFARPARIKGNREGAIWRDRIAVAVADETHFTVGAIDVSVDRALALVSARRPGTAQAASGSPLIPMRPSEGRKDGKGDHAPYSHARRLFDRREKLLGPVGISFARKQGELFRLSGVAGTDPGYMRDRKARLALFSEPAARKWIFNRARERHAGLEKPFDPGRQDSHTWLAPYHPPDASENLRRNRGSISARINQGPTRKLTAREFAGWSLA